MNTATSDYTLLKRVKDERFDIDDLHHYSLSIQVGVRDFQLCVTDVRENKPLLFEDFRLDNIKTVNTRLRVLHSIFDNHHLLQAGFWSSAKLSLKTHKFSLVPVSHFVTESAKDYLALNCEIKPNMEDVHYYRHIASDAVNVYAGDKKLINWIKAKYPSLKLHLLHQGSALIEGILRHDDHSHDKTMFCLADRGILHVVVSEKQKLLYYNQFAVRGSDEYLKYVMLVFKELQLNPKTNKVIIWGSLKSQSKHVEHLKKYIRNISYGSRPSYLKFGFEFDEIPEHQFFDVFSIYLCD
ncbi:MAG: DUF3822 family protein [Cyclobacteriaceae bacterium]|nr:DUF3822 family protein [Cyclobacteriaceae bacterium HetDA_MAG_MS6]